MGNTRKKQAELKHRLEIHKFLGPERKEENLKAIKRLRSGLPKVKTEATLLNRIKEMLSENKVDLPANKQELFRTTHHALTHLLHTDTREPERNGYSEHLLSGHNKKYVANLRDAIGQNLGGPLTHNPGDKGGPVNYKRPKHQRALLWASHSLLNDVRARSGNPYNYGSPKKEHKISDDDFDTHVQSLRSAVKAQPWPEEGMKDTLAKLDRRS